MSFLVIFFKVLPSFIFSENLHYFIYLPFPSSWVLILTFSVLTPEPPVFKLPSPTSSLPPISEVLGTGLSWHLPGNAVLSLSCTFNCWSPPTLFCHFFPHFTLCFLVSEFELILGAVPIRFLNYHLVFSPHRSSFCPITADIRISAITHGLE